jgi:putative FmdB family regulatory protein
MPIYEYQCKACGELKEALQKLSDAPLARCPACGAEALRKKVSAVAFRLKGGGWYETDFKTGDRKNLAGESGEGKGDSKKDDGKKSEGGGKEPASAGGKAADRKTGPGKDKPAGGSSSAV